VLKRISSEKTGTGTAFAEEQSDSLENFLQKPYLSLLFPAVKLHMAEDLQ
jgi:hypothetical protein